jgi:hypothetical protein
MDFVDKITKAIDEGKFSVGIFLYFVKDIWYFTNFLIKCVPYYYIGYIYSIFLCNYIFFLD